jgi:hypothetical protein
MRLSIDDLKAVLHYDPETGWFTWKIKTHGRCGLIFPGDRAGTEAEGRRQIKYQERIYRESRLAWAFMTGEWPPKGFDVEHWDEDGSNNKWVNLRLATRTQNNHNRSRPRSDNVSGHSGVSLAKTRKGTVRWHARVSVKRRAILLGNFDTVEEAIAARRAGELRYFGEFAPQRT